MLKVPKYRENESCYELEELENPIKPYDKVVFHTRLKSNYEPLITMIKRNKVVKEPFKVKKLSFNNE